MNNLPAIKQNTAAILSKTKNLMGIADKILSSKTPITEEVIEEWIKALWAWADECNMPHGHLPRDRAKLLALTQINFYNMGLGSLPEAFGNLTQLNSLDLWDNNIQKLPDAIVNLLNLKKLQLRGNPLTLTSPQQVWIETLKKNGCTVYMDNLPATNKAQATTTVKIVNNQSTTLATAFQYKPYIQFGHRMSVNSVAFSPDGKTALSGSEDRTLKLWDIGTGKMIRTFEGHAGYVYSVAFSPDGKMALSGSSGGTLKLWDISTGEENSISKEIYTFKSYSARSVRVYYVAFSPDGKMALLGSSDNTVSLWDISAGKEISSIGEEEDDSYVQSVAFSPDGKMALLGIGDGTLRLWNIGKGIRVFEGHDDSCVYSVAFSPDGKTALSGSNDEALKLWDINTGQEIRTFKGHAGYVVSVAFSPDGKTVLSGSSDSTIKLWDISTGREIRSFFGGDDSSVRSVTFSPNGRMVMVLSDSNEDVSERISTIKLWDIVTGREIRTIIAFDTLEWSTINSEGDFEIVNYADGECEWISITPEGYFDHSKNGRRYLNVLTSPMSAIAIDDATYAHYYRPKGLLESDRAKN
jgi:WD40 repeat protein